MGIRTKRFAYGILSDYYGRLENSLRDGFGVTAYENGCVTILGIRHVGKTTLLRQLADIDGVSSKYIDCSGVSEDFDFENFYEGMLNRGIRRLFLDEICKIPDDLVADFIETTKYYSSQIIITMTGSVSGVVSKMSDRIGRCRTLLLPPITYTERLVWGAGYEEVDLTGVSLRGLTSYDKLMVYLRQQNTLLENAFLTRLAYLYRFADKFRSENNYEVELVYGIETSFDEYRLGGMETKNRKSSSVDENDIARYRGIVDYLDLKDLCISCSDEEAVYKNGCQFYRGDLIMIDLELEYFNQRILDLSDDINSIFCRETITELLRKYGLI